MDQISAHKSLTLMKLLIVILKLYLSASQVIGIEYFSMYGGMR